ncbi:MAG: hypothetical protein MUC60_00515 [Oscillatoria sp. Prado101]|nr:hypothetical protein [Oscillatoria sp. Prado101]
MTNHQQGTFDGEWGNSIAGAPGQVRTVEFEVDVKLNSCPVRRGKYSE